MAGTSCRLPLSSTAVRSRRLAVATPSRPGEAGREWKSHAGRKSKAAGSEQCSKPGSLASGGRWGQRDESDETPSDSLRMGSEPTRITRSGQEHHRDKDD